MKLEQVPSRCLPEKIDNTKPESVLLVGYFGKDALTSKAIQFVRDAARETGVSYKFEVLSFTKDKTEKNPQDQIWPVIKSKLEEINASKIFAFGNDFVKAVFNVGHNALNVRKGYGYLSATSNICVHLLPDVLHVARNRFRARWLKEDLAWALLNNPPSTSGTMEYVTDEGVKYLLDSYDVVWDTETFGHFADKCFKLLTVAICAADSNRVIVWSEKDLNDPIKRAWLIEIYKNCKLSGQNRKYDLLANKHSVGTSVHPRDTGDCTNVLAKLLRADGAGGLEELATTIGLVGHKREAGERLNQANLTINNIREHRYEAVPTKWDYEFRVSEKTGRKQKRKIVVESRPPTEDEADNQVLEQLQKRMEKYPELCGSKEDWLAASKRSDDEMWYSQAFYSPEIRDRYCAFDVLSTAALLRKLRNDVKSEPNIERVYNTIVRLAPRTVQHIEEGGLFIDMEALNNFSEFIVKRQAELLSNIRAIAGEQYNPSSDKQTQELLYKTLKLPVIKETAGGNPSTDSNTLGKLKDKHEIVPMILEYKKLAKLQSNYADGLRPHIRDDGAIHCSFNIMGTETGRMSVSTPNMQTIPSRGEFAKMAKSIYKARPGYKYLVFDYKTLEPMMAAVLSNDDNMIASFQSGEDFHTRTAKIISLAVWGNDFESCGLTLEDRSASESESEYLARVAVHKDKLAKEQKQRRSIAKTIGLACLYGQGPESMAERANCTLKEATQAQDAIMRAYPDLKKWIRKCVADATVSGECWTVWDGLPARRRPIPDIGDSENDVKAHGEICSYNTPVQGSGHEYLLASANAIVAEFELNGYNARIVLLVHDAIYIEVAEDEIHDVYRVVKQIMTSWPFGRLKLLVDAEWGDRLSELVPWTQN